MGKNVEKASGRKNKKNSLNTHFSTFFSKFWKENLIEENTELLAWNIHLSNAE